MPQPGTQDSSWSSGLFLTLQSDLSAHHPGCAPALLNLWFPKHIMLVSLPDHCWRMEIFRDKGHRTHGSHPFFLLHPLTVKVRRPRAWPGPLPCFFLACKAASVGFFGYWIKLLSCPFSSRDGGQNMWPNWSCKSWNRSLGFGVEIGLISFKAVRPIKRVKTAIAYRHSTVGIGNQTQLVIWCYLTSLRPESQGWDSGNTRCFGWL